MADMMILGAGGFGTSLAVLLHQYGYDVILWSAFEREINEMRRYGENRRLLPGIAVDQSIRMTTDIAEAKGVKMFLFAVPSFALRQVAQQAKPYIEDDAVLVNVGKGFEEGTQKRLSVVLREEYPKNPVVILSGPSHAEEIARGVPTTVVATSENRQAAELVQDTLMNANLRVYVNNDMIGVELGGALKNIIAVCAGICDGMGLGDNSKAALMTRGIAEISRLGVAMGAKVETFAGLTGVGDLIVTCTSMHSRNRRAGIYIGQGLSMEEAVKRVGMTVEGCKACKSAYALAQEYGVDMPIVTELYQVLYENKDIREALTDLMERPKRHEDERIWLLSK
ncbi:MAG: NAD(P)H-dependent glycerol-3-phosphate dehydrogenase [Massiliimalia sp.]